MWSLLTAPLKKTDVVSPAGLWLLRIALHLPLPPHGLHRHNQSPSRYPWSSAVIEYLGIGKPIIHENIGHFSGELNESGSTMTNAAQLDNLLPGNT